MTDQNNGTVATLRSDVASSINEGVYTLYDPNAGGFIQPTLFGNMSRDKLCVDPTIYINTTLRTEGCGDIMSLDLTVEDSRKKISITLCDTQEPVDFEIILPKTNDVFLTNSK